MIPMMHQSRRAQVKGHLRLTQSQGLPQVRNVIEALEFGHPAAQKEGEEVDEEAGVLANGEVGLVAHLLEPEPQLWIHNHINQNLLTHSAEFVL